MFRNLKIRNKLLLMPILATVAFLLILFVTWILNDRSEGLLTRIESDYYPSLELSRDLEEMLAAIQRGMQDAAAATDPEMLQETDSLWTALLHRLDDEDENHGMRAEELALLKTKLYEYYQMARAVTLRMIEGQTDETFTAALQVMTTKYNRVKAILEINTGRNQREMAAAIASTRANHRISMGVITMTTLLCTVLLVGLSVFVARFITAPLSSVVGAARELAQGNLDVKLAATSKDEIGELAQAFAVLIQATEGLAKAANAIGQGDYHVLVNVRGEKDILGNALATMKSNLITTLREKQQEIVDRKRAEHQLQVFNAQLDRSNRELQDFAYVASHDLQEPLRKIQAFGDRLKSKFGEALAEQGRDYLERMQNAAGRMQDLIVALLTYSRVTTKAQPFVPVDLAKVTPEVLADLEVRIEQLEGRVEIGSLPVIEADPTQIRQLLQNLIGNALKFHQPGVPPVVRVDAQILAGHSPEPHLCNGQLCELTVADNGIGFDEKYLDRIFAVFQRLHGRDAYEGTGVGLAVCRKIAERHGGSITAKSAPGQGATFIVRLPVKPANQERKP